MSRPHPLLQFLDDAAMGVFPPVDGGVTHCPSLADGREAIVCFTGHAVIASRLSIEAFNEPKPDGFGGALHPGIQQLMAGRGLIGVNDVTLVARGLGAAEHQQESGPSPLSVTDRWDDHSRVRYARELRDNVTVYGDDSGFVTIGDGLAGRNEMSIEVRDDLHGSGTGRELIRGALQLVPADAPVFAAVSPGNARSLRAFLSQGFVPVGSEVIITPA